MRALVYHGPRDERVESVPDPTIEKPADAIVCVTSTNVCGADVHTYEGRTSVEPGEVRAHEHLGEVIDVGRRSRIRKSDRVAPPLDIACGYGRDCARVLTGVPNGGSIGVVVVLPEKDPKRRDRAWAPVQCDVTRGDQRLRDPIHAGRATPSLIISHHRHLDAALDAYEHFDARERRWTKALLEPHT